MAANKTPLALDSVYNNYEDLKEALDEYQQQNFVHFYMRSSRTVEGLLKRCHKKSYNANLKYGEIDFACIHGGKNFKSQSAGIRPNQQTFQLFCTAHIKVRTTDDGQKLIIRELDDNHSHEKSEIAFKHLPQQRRLNEDETNEVLSLLSIPADKRVLQGHIFQRTGKSVTLRDIHNLARKANVIEVVL